MSGGVPGLRWHTHHPITLALTLALTLAPRPHPRPHPHPHPHPNAAGGTRTTAPRAPCSWHSTCRPRRRSRRYLSGSRPRGSCDGRPLAEGRRGLASVCRRVVAPFHPLQVSAAVGGMALPPGQQANAAAVPVVALQQFLAALRARDFEGAKRLAFQSESLHLEPCPCCDARVARRVSERGGAFVAQSSPTSRTIGPC
jgi:hypothetical protein